MEKIKESYNKSLSLQYLGLTNYLYSRSNLGKDSSVCKHFSEVSGRIADYPIDLKEHYAKRKSLKKLKDFDKDTRQLLEGMLKQAVHAQKR